MPDATGRGSPTRGEVGAALAVALALALAFVGAAVRPDRALLPFVPERYEPLRSEALAAGTLDPAELERGNVAMGDKFNQSLAWDRIQQDRLRCGAVARWTDEIGGGAAFVPQMAQVYQPWNLLLLAPLPAAAVYGIWYVLHLVLWGVGAHWFLRRSGVGPTGALFGVVVAVLGLWTQARVHHNVILSAALPLWPLLTIVRAGFADAAAGRRGFGPGRVAAVAALLGVTWSGGFAPVSLQVSMLTAGYALAAALAARRCAPLAPLGGAAALGGALALAQMGPTLVAAAASSRGAATPELLADAGLAFGHLAGLWFPDLLHWPDRPRQYPSFAAFVLTTDRTAVAINARFNWPETAFSTGLVGSVAALAGLASRRRLALGFGAVAALAFGLATARGPFLELSAYLPGARAGDLRRFLFLMAVGLTVVGAVGADTLARGRPAARRAAAVGCALLAVGSLALLAMWGQPFATAAEFAHDWAARMHAAVGGVVEGVPLTPEIIVAEMQRDPAQLAAQHRHLAATFARAAAIAALAAGLLLAAPGRRAVLGLAALAAVELLAAGHGTIVPVPLERVQRLPLALEPVAAANRDADPAAPVRLVRLEAPGAGAEPRLLPPNLGAFHGLEDLAAYNPLPPRRMEELFLAIEPDRPGKPSAVFGGAGVRGFHDPRSLGHPLLDLLGARFVLAGIALPDAVRTAAGLVDRTPAGVPPPCRLYERTTALPRATFVDTLEVLPAVPDRLARLGEPGRDPRRAAIVEGGAPLTGDGVPDADVEVVARTPGRVLVDVDAREPGLLRLADPWAPGWTARVDGVPHPLWITDHYLRGVRLGPGRHTVEFRFDGFAAVGFERIAGLALVTVAGLAGLALVRRRSGRRPAATPADASAPRPGRGGPHASTPRQPAVRPDHR